MTESGGETSVTDNASISMHMVAAAITNNRAWEMEWHVPVHVCAHEALPVVAVDQGPAGGGAQALGAGDAEAEQGHRRAALSQLQAEAIRLESW